MLDYLDAVAQRIMLRVVPPSLFLVIIDLKSVGGGFFEFVPAIAEKRACSFVIASRKHGERCVCVRNAESA